MIKNLFKLYVFKFLSNGLIPASMNMIGVLTSCGLDRWFEALSGETNNYKIVLLLFR